MSRRCRRRWLIFLISLIVLSVPLPASAAVPGKSPPAERAARIVQSLAGTKDPATAFALLDPADQRLVLAYLVPARVIFSEETVPEGDFSVAAAGCWERRPSVRAVNFANVTLWEYEVRLYWCGDGSWVTYSSMTRRGSVYQAFWQFVGDVGQSTIGGVGYNYVRHFRQGYFRLCLTSQYGCIDHVYPWIDQTGQGNGGYTSSWGR